MYLTEIFYNIFSHRPLDLKCNKRKRFQRPYWLTNLISTLSCTASCFQSHSDKYANVIINVNCIMFSDSNWLKNAIINIDCILYSNSHWFTIVKSNIRDGKRFDPVNMTKAPYHQKIKVKTEQKSKRKTSITQRMWIDLGRSVWVPSVIMV